MYSRRNSDPMGPGHWVTGDGEYEFTRLENRRWQLRHRAAFESDPVLGTAPTLAAGFAMAARHYMTPAGRWQYEEA